MTTINAFERIHTGEPGVFAQDGYFRTPAYRKFMALDLKNPPTWPDFRDKRLASVEVKVAKPMAGHATTPLNLPGSRVEPLRQK